MTTSRREFISASIAAAALMALGRPPLLRGALWLAQEPTFTPIRRNVGYFTLRGGTIDYLVNPRRDRGGRQPVPRAGPGIPRRAESAVRNPADRLPYQHPPPRRPHLAMRDPLAGFESFGPFGSPNPRDALTCAYEEIVTV